VTSVDSTVNSTAEDEPTPPTENTDATQATATAAAAAEQATPDEREATEPPVGSTRPRTGRLGVLLVVAALGVGALGAWFTVQASGLRDTEAAANTALVDTGATAEVSTAVTTSLNKVFSYSYDKPEVTERAAADALRGPALDTYDRLFAQVRELAPQQKIVLTTRVVHIAVQSIAGDRARLLVFLDQSATRADNNTTSTGAAQLSVTAERHDGRWMIIDLTPR
jgi:Mce-associated membrane protein